MMINMSQLCLEGLCHGKIKDVENLIKAGFIFIIGIAILSGMGIPESVVESFTDLGVFMIITAIIVFFAVIIIPPLKRYL